MRLALLLLVSCAHVAPPTAPPVVVSGCVLRKAPPVAPVAPPVACPGFEACLTLADAATLDEYLGAIALWSSDAWTLCKPPDPTP